MSLLSEADLQTLTCFVHAVTVHVNRNSGTHTRREVIAGLSLAWRPNWQRRSSVAEAWCDMERLSPHRADGCSRAVPMRLARVSCPRFCPSLSEYSGRLGHFVALCRGVRRGTKYATAPSAGR